MSSRPQSGHPLGWHRVIAQLGILPQAAQRLDASLPIYDNELLIAVDCLQIDSASFAQLKAAHGNAKQIGDAIREIVLARGKMQNPVTGSGGMLLGRVAQIGSHSPATLKVGDRIATLVSLTATPLHLESVREVDLTRERVHVTGHAILFATSLFARLPEDLPEGTALAALDICGAPALSAREVKPGQTVFVLGLGKAGRSVVAALSQQKGLPIKILGADADAKAVEFCQKNYAGDFTTLNARDPMSVTNWVAEHTAGKLADFAINTANVSDTEMATILPVHDSGTCLFFGMATNFQKAALGAEAVARDVRLLIGSGYVQGHAEFMFDLLRADNVLREFFVNSFR